MKHKTRAWLLALSMLGATGAAYAQSETYRCQLADGGIAFRNTPCPLADLVGPEPPAPVAPRTEAASAVKAEPAPVTAKAAPVAPARVERSVSTPAPVLLPVPPAARRAVAEDEDFVKPTRRK